jgi:hypothetical protein
MANAKILQEAIMKLLSKIDSSPMTPGNTKPNMNQMLTNDLAAPRSLPLADDIPVSGVRDEVVNQGDIFRGMPNVSNELPTARDTLATKNLAEQLGLEVGKSPRRIQPSTRTGTKSLPSNETGPGPSTLSESMSEPFNPLDESVRSKYTIDKLESKMEELRGTVPNDVLEETAMDALDAERNALTQANKSFKGKTVEQRTKIQEGRKRAAVQGNQKYMTRGNYTDDAPAPNHIFGEAEPSPINKGDYDLKELTAGKTSVPIPGKLRNIREARKREDAGIDLEGEQYTKDVNDIEQIMVNEITSDPLFPNVRHPKSATMKALSSTAQTRKVDGNINGYIQDVYNRFGIKGSMDDPRNVGLFDINKIKKAYKQGTTESAIRDKYNELGKAADDARNPNLSDVQRRQALNTIKDIDEWLTSGGDAVAKGSYKAFDNPGKSNVGIRNPNIEALAFQRTPEELSQARRIQAQQGPNNAKLGKSGELLGDAGVKELRNPTFPNVLNLGRHGTAGVAIPKHKGGRMSLQEIIQFLEQERSKVGQQ